MALDSCLPISQVPKVGGELRKLPDERPLQTLFPLQDHRGHRDEIGGRMGDTVIVKPQLHQVGRTRDIGQSTAKVRRLTVLLKP